MDDTTGLPRTVLVGVGAYPFYLARTLMQLGYEPSEPDEFNRLPNIFTYIALVKEQRGYMALYTGFKYYLPAVVVKKATYNLMATAVNHKMEKSDCDISEFIAVCLRESALRIHTTLLTYPLVTLGVGYISSTFFGTEEKFEYTFKALYSGVLPKLIIEVTMIWVSALSRRLFHDAIEDEIALQIACRVPPFIVQSLLYPLNVVSTVMADNGRSVINPRFENWTECYRYLKMDNQLKRGSSFFYRRNYSTVHSGDRYSIIKRYF